MLGKCLFDNSYCFEHHNYLYGRHIYAGRGWWFAAEKEIVSDIFMFITDFSLKCWMDLFLSYSLHFCQGMYPQLQKHVQTITKSVWKYMSEISPSGSALLLCNLGNVFLPCLKPGSTRLVAKFASGLCDCAVKCSRIPDFRDRFILLRHPFLLPVD